MYRIAVLIKVDLYKVLAFGVNTGNGHSVEINVH